MTMSDPQKFDPNDMTDEEAAELASAEAWLDELERDPSPLATKAADASDLRRISQADAAIGAAREELAAAVAAARDNGRSWGAIGMVLGVSKQAARERFGLPHQRTAPREQASTPAE